MVKKGKTETTQNKGDIKTIASKQQGTDKLKSHIGLTVVEFLIGFTVIAVIALLTAPGVSGLLQGRQIGNAASELARGLSLAKIEAEKRHSTVRVCPSSDGLSCRQDGDWNRGWLVFSDGNGDGSPRNSSASGLMILPMRKYASSRQARLLTCLHSPLPDWSKTTTLKRESS